MFGIGPIEMLVLMAIGSGTVGVPLGLPPLAADATIERAVPEDCLLLAYTAGTAEPDAKSSNQTEQLLAEKEVQEFLAQIGEQVTSAVKQLGSHNPQMAPLARFGPPIVGLLTRPAAFYVSHLQIQPNGPPDVRAALIVNCGSRMADAKKLLADLEEMAAKSGAPVDQIKDLTLGGVALRQLDVPGGLEVDWGFKGDYFLLSVGSGAAQELIDRIAKPGKPADWLVALKKRFGIERLGTLGYLNASRAREIWLPLVPDPKAKLALDALGLTGVQMVASASGLDKQGIVNRMLVNLDGAPQGLFELVSDKPLALADLRSIPRDATLAVGARLDLATVYRRALEQVGKVDPQVVATVEGNLAGVEQALGFQIEKGLLASLGDLWTIYASAQEGASPWTGLVVSVSVRDQAKLVEIQERLVNLVKLQAGGPGGPPFSIRKTKLGDIEVHQIMPKGPVPVSPVWCVLKDRLVVAATLQTLKAHLARDAKAPSLADVPEVARRFDGKSAPSMFTYQDTKAALRGMYALVQMYGPIATGALAQQGIEFDLPPLPSLESLDPHIMPLVGLARRTKQGLAFERFQTVPVLGGPDTATTGVLVGLLLPAVQAAREAARRNQSMNNLKQLALAMHNHHDVYKHFPAAAIVDKDGKPLLSWRVAVLPYIEEAALYKQFHLDEPWDSEHNRPLLDKMPLTYASPNIPSLGGKTIYLLPAGEKTLFAGKDAPSMRGILDGSSKTIMIVEAGPDQAVEWSKPEDLKFDSKKPLSGLTGTRPGGFLAAFADGSVRFISASIDPEVLRALFTPAGQEPNVQLDE